MGVSENGVCFLKSATSMRKIMFKKLQSTSKNWIWRGLPMVFSWFSLKCSPVHQAVSTLANKDKLDEATGQ